MSMRDFGNKTKAYKRGLSDDAAINAKKEQQLKRENDKIIERQKQSDKKLEAGMNNLQDIVETTVNERVYGEDKSVHLMDLNEQERAYVIGTIYSLAQKQENMSQNQREYFTKLKAYLLITDTYKAPLDNIARVEDFDVSIAVLKVVYEFKYLKNSTWDFESDTDFQEYLEGFRVSRKDIKETKERIVESLKFGDGALISQYSSHFSESEKVTTYSGNDASNEKSVYSEDRQKQGKEEAEERSQVAFKRVIQTYSHSDEAFRNIGDGVNLVEETRELLLDTLSDIFNKITPIVQSEEQRELLEECINNYQYYINSNEKLSKEKKEAKLASGKKSVGNLSIKGAMLLTLPLIISPVILNSMRGNKKAQSAYSEDLIRLQHMTLNHVVTLHEEITNKNIKIDKLLIEIKYSLDSLGISYDELPSVDFRATSAFGNTARGNTRKYIQEHISKILEDDALGTIKIYNKELNGKQEGYLTKRECEGAFNKIMEYQGSPDEMVGLIDSTLTNNGKEGVLFLDDQLIIRNIWSHPVRIRYEDMDDVIGNKIIAHTYEGETYRYIVGEINVDEDAFKAFLEDVMTFWKN